jgi:hypothetical protein
MPSIRVQITTRGVGTISVTRGILCIQMRCDDHIISEFAFIRIFELIKSVSMIYRESSF